MKRTFLFRIAILSFLLAGLPSISSQFQLQAQSLSQDIYSLPTENFVTPAVAIVRLDNALVSIKNQLAPFTEGTPQYNKVYARYVCYNTTKESIEGGKTVAESIVDGMSGVGADQYDLAKNDLPTFRQDLINLLKS